MVTCATSTSIWIKKKSAISTQKIVEKYNSLVVVFEEIILKTKRQKPNKHKAYMQNQKQHKVYMQSQKQHHKAYMQSQKQQ